jgi:uncharacterized protein (DUF488 family)
VRIATIGYQRRTPAELVGALVAAGVTRLIDVRAVPASRKRGFAKTPLAAALAAAGIEYVHVRAAGNPFRAAAGWREPYRAYLAEHPAVVDEVIALAGVVPGLAALLCVEHDVADCHRGVLADAIRDRTGATVLDL